MEGGRSVGDDENYVRGIGVGIYEDTRGSSVGPGDRGVVARRTSSPRSYAASRRGRHAYAFGGIRITVHADSRCATARRSLVVGGRRETPERVGRRRRVAFSDRRGPVLCHAPLVGVGVAGAAEVGIHNVLVVELRVCVGVGVHVLRHQVGRSIYGRELVAPGSATLLPVLAVAFPAVLPVLTTGLPAGLPVLTVLATAFPTALPVLPAAFPVDPGVASASYLRGHLGSVAYELRELSERCIDLVDACGGSQIGVEGRSEDIRERGGSAALLPASTGFIGSVLAVVFPVHPLLVAAIFAITTTT